MNEHTGRRQSIRPAGMPCPQCNQPIIIDPMFLLSSAPIECASCGLELRVNMEQSGETLMALKTYMDKFAEIERGYAGQVNEFSDGGATGSRTRSRRRSGGTGQAPRRRGRAAR